MKPHNDNHWRLVEWLHIQTLAAIMRHRAWRPDEIAFQGGTALHLGHGSPRFSEDLDFLLSRNRNADEMMRQVASEVDTAALQAHGGSVELKCGREDRNPRAFTLKLSLPHLRRKIRLKCEFWGTLEGLIECYRTQPRMVQAPPGVMLTPFTVPVGDLEEILLDKMHALVSRPYPKVRDLFDIWWLRTQTPLRNMSQEEALAGRIDYHLRMYPDGPETPAAFAKALRETGAARFDALSDDEIAKDLERWLPPELDSLRQPSVICGMRACVSSECHRLATLLERIASNNLEYSESMECGP